MTDRTSARARHPDPRRLDIFRFAAERGNLDGVLGASDVARLVADAALPVDGSVAWSVVGERRKVVGESAPQTWLHLQARADVVLTCQRCLQPLLHPLRVDRRLRFVDSEAEAERLDEDGDDDVLAVPARGLDLPALVEDELILALPLVPRHDHCPQPLPVAPDPAHPETVQDDRPGRPFDALRGWRARKSDDADGTED